MMQFYSSVCPICGKSVLPACFKPRERMNHDEWKLLNDMIDRKLAVHMVTEHPDDLDDYLDTAPV